VAIRDFPKMRAHYSRLVAQNNTADGVNVTPIIVVASIDLDSGVTRMAGAHMFQAV
jgi:hypothetical protein